MIEIQTEGFENSTEGNSQNVIEPNNNHQESSRSEIKFEKIPQSHQEEQKINHSSELKFVEYPKFPENKFDLDHKLLDYNKGMRDIVDQSEQAMKSSAQLFMKCFDDMVEKTSKYKQSLFHYHENL